MKVVVRCGFIVCCAALTCAFNAGAQGLLPNGATQTGVISVPAETDSWTFSADAGDRIILRLGEISQTNSFTPRLRLMNPLGGQQALGAAALVVELNVVATNSGVFTIEVSDNIGTTATGTYRLSLAKLPGTIVINGDGGTLTNGTFHTGSIAIGDLDIYSFEAMAGEAVIVRAGELLDAGGFTPWVRLFGPGGNQVDSGFGGTAGEVSATVTSNGTCFVVVGDGNGSLTGAGDYCLTLAKTGVAVVVSPGDEGGSLTNGLTHSGVVMPGDLDLWTVEAAVGEALIVRAGEVSDTNTFTPWVRLYSPGGTFLGSGFGAVAGEVAVTVSSNGTFLVVVSDGNGSLSGSGTYRLSMAKTGNAVQVSAADEGGSMTNGVMHLGDIKTGELDVWTFEALSGEAVIVRAGEITDISVFTPWVRMYGPSGALLASGFGAVAGEAAGVTATAGTYVVVVGDGNGLLSGSGNYRLTLARAMAPVVVSPGDEGGGMTNGVMHLGTTAAGDLDLWTLDANTGDSIVARVGAITETNTYTPWIRLYSPSGVLLSSGFGAVAGEATATATANGQHLIVISDGNSALSGSGNYRLTLARTGTEIFTSQNDEGGGLTNGWQHPGIVLTGDLDVWSVEANAGDAIVARVGEITDTNTFTPWVRIYGPGGGLLDSGFGAFAGEVAVTAMSSGRYLLVVSDGNSAFSGSGNYRFSLARTGTLLSVAPGDEGGSLAGSDPAGVITRGDLDAYSFGTCAGEPISLRVDETLDSGGFTPWLRLYGPTGSLLGNVSGAATAQLNLAAPLTGRYLVIMGDGNASLSGLGSYNLLVNGMTERLRLCNPVVFGTNATVRGIGGTPGAQFRLYTTTNISLPFVSWTSLLTNQFSVSGAFAYTNSFGILEPQRYFRFDLP